MGKALDMNNSLEHTALEFYAMDQVCWERYVEHVQDPDEFYYQYCMEQTPELLDLIQDMTPGVIYYSVLLKDTKEMVGYVGIAPDSDDIEIYVFKEYRRRSYGYTVLKAFSDLYLNGTITGKEEKEVVAVTLFDNDPAIKLLEKVGFKKRATGFRVDLSGDEERTSACICEYVYTN